jgi:LPXTG-motif cell wall-anchored protein
MRANGFGRWMVGAVAAVAALGGGQVAASNYPPDDTTVTTVYVGGDPPGSSSTGDLPETGTESGATMKIAGGAVVAGVGMLVVARVRRRPTAG